MPDLPLILLGPVLRCVEAGGVSVFVATSQASSVRVALCDGQVDAAPTPPELANHEAHTMWFGAASYYLAAHHRDVVPPRSLRL